MSGRAHAVTRAGFMAAPSGRKRQVCPVLGARIFTVPGEQFFTVSGETEITMEEIVRGGAAFAAPDGPFAGVRWGALESDPAYIVAMARAQGSEFDPYGVLIKVGPEVRAAAVMRVGEAELPVNLGYRLAYRPRCSALIAQGGFVGADDPRAAGRLLHAVRAAMKTDRIDAAMIAGVRVG